MTFDDYHIDVDYLFRKAAKKYRPLFNPRDWSRMSNRLDQMEKNKRISKEAMADKFIELANTFATTEDKEQVSAAIMFAAARYNAFDAYSKSKNLAQDKNSALEWYCKEYGRMLDANMDELIER